VKIEAVDIHHREKEETPMLAAANVATMCG
jgi:hypothetical protein